MTTSEHDKSVRDVLEMTQRSGRMLIALGILCQMVVNAGEYAVPGDIWKAAKNAEAVVQENVL